LCLYPNDIISFDLHTNIVYKVRHKRYMKKVKI